MSFASSDIGVGKGFVTVTPSDTVNATKTIRMLYVGVGGNVTGVAPDGSVALFANVPAGAYLFGNFIRINLTGTAASSFVGYV